MQNIRSTIPANVKTELDKMNLLDRFLFMEYINKTTDLVAEKSKSNRIQKIHNRVRKEKDSDKVGVKLMQAWEEKYYDKLEAREEGLAEGMRIVIRMICRKLRKGLSVQEIAEDLEEDEALISSICEVASHFAPEYNEQKIWEEYKNRKSD